MRQRDRRGAPLPPPPPVAAPAVRQGRICREPSGNAPQSGPRASPSVRGSSALGFAVNFPSRGSVGWLERQAAAARRAVCSRPPRTRTSPPRCGSWGPCWHSGHQRLSGNNAKGVSKLLTSEQRFEKDNQAHVFS